MAPLGSISVLCFLAQVQSLTQGAFGYQTKLEGIHSSHERKWSRNQITEWNKNFSCLASNLMHIPFTKHNSNILLKTKSSNNGIVSEFFILKYFFYF